MAAMPSAFSLNNLCLWAGRIVIDAALPYMYSTEFSYYNNICLIFKFKTMNKTFTHFVLYCLLMALGSISAKAADRLLIVGEAVWGGWSIDNSVEMLNTTEQPDVWKATVYLKANSDFKFLTTTDWGNLEYRAGDNTVTLASGVQGKLVSSAENVNDNKFQVSEAANYDIVCDLDQETITVSKAAYQDSELNFPALYLVGSATPGGWSLSQAAMLKQDASNPVAYSGTVSLTAGEFKLCVNTQTGYGQTFFQVDPNDAGRMVFGGDDNKWQVTEAGDYDISANVKDMTISVKKHDATGISKIATEADGAAEYFSLSGVKVSSPVSGVYVKRVNGKCTKVVVK